MNQIDQNIHRSINIETKTIFGLNIFDGSKSKLIDQYISRMLKRDRGDNSRATLVFTPNPEQVVLSKNDPHFLAALKHADLLIPDGTGIVVASRLLAAFGKAERISERISGVDLLKEIVGHFPESSAVVIGGRNGDEDATHEGVLTIEGKKVAWLPAYRDVQHPTVEEVQNLDRFLRKEKPDVVFVAFGAPFQEYWSIRHHKDLEELGVKLIMVVGGAVDVLSGRLQRAPKMVRALGLEWLYRLIQEPWRWRRQLRLVEFIGMTLQQLFAR